MRRAEREITDRQQINQILRSNTVCHLAMVDDGLPYVVPMTYAYEDGCSTSTRPRRGARSMC